MADKAEGTETSLSRIGRYEVVGILGRGAMGVVYKAKDPEIGREVAIKTLRRVHASHLHDADGAIERFKTEARSAGNLRHPNIITIFEANRDGDMPYLVMDFVAGEGLDLLITTRGKLEPAVVMAYLSQIASGLDYAHSRGVIHRDIKPSNILIDKAGRVFILDFGVALIRKGISEHEPVRGDGGGPVVGSPAYMSPEQVLNEELDARSDLFSLAIVTFECLTGQRPFPGETFSSVASKILSGKPISLTAAVPTLPLALEAEFERAFSRDRTKRFNSAEEMLTAFRKALGQIKVDLLTGKPHEPRKRKRTTGWRGFLRSEYVPENKEASTVAPNTESAKELPKSGRGDPGEDFEVIQPQAQARNKMTRPGILFNPEASIDDRMVRGRARPISSASPSEKVAAFSAVVFIAIGMAGLYYYWPEISSIGKSSPVEIAPVENQGRVVLSVAALARGEALPRPTTSPVPAGKGISEMSDSELMGVIVEGRFPEGQILRALREAQKRGVSDLVLASVYSLQSSSYVVRVETLKVLGELGDKRIVPYLLLLLDDTDSAVRGHVARALGLLGDARALPKLTAVLKVETVPEVKIAITRAIQRLGGSV